MPVRSVRRRYLLISIESDILLSFTSLNNVVENEILYLYGVKGIVGLGYRMIEYDPEESTAIIRCFHNKLNELRLVLAHIFEIQGKPARIDVKRVSGTIKSLKRGL